MDGANTTSAAGSFGKAEGHDAHTATMILALAARHRAERPAISMEGGIKILWSGFARRRLNRFVLMIRNCETALPSNAVFVEK